MRSPGERRSVRTLAEPSLGPMERVRERLRKVRYKLAGKGDVFFYAEEDVRRLAAGAGFTDFKLVDVVVSGSGYILVGGCGGG